MVDSLDLDALLEAYNTRAAHDHDIEACEGCFDDTEVLFDVPRLAAELREARAEAERWNDVAETAEGEVESLTAIRERAEQVRDRAERLLAEAKTVGVTSDEWRAELRAAERILGAAPDLVERLMRENERGMAQQGVAPSPESLEEGTRRLAAWKRDHPPTDDLTDLEADRLREGIGTALRELGEPNEGYPAPVVNAVEILRGLLGAAPSPEPPPEEQT